MTREEAIRILDPKTTREALLAFAYDPEGRVRVVEEACMVACAALRAQQEAEKNEPLTLKELQEMDGEPVWVDCIDSEGYGCWMLVDVPHEGLNNRVYCAVFEDYGVEWLAYRRKPEEVQE